MFLPSSSSSSSQTRKFCIAEHLWIRSSVRLTLATGCCTWRSWQKSWRPSEARFVHSIRRTFFYCCYIWSGSSGTVTPSSTLMLLNGIIYWQQRRSTIFLFLCVRWEEQHLTRINSSFRCPCNSCANSAPFEFPWCQKITLVKRLKLCLAARPAKQAPLDKLETNRQRQQFFPFFFVLSSFSYGIRRRKKRRLWNEREKKS